MTTKMNELKRRVEAGDPEAIKAVQEAFDGMTRTLTEWVESILPALNQLTAILNRPEVRAAIEKGDTES